MTQPADSNANKAVKPWWRYGLAWLVFGAPAAGVVAGLIVLYLAVVGQDPVLNYDYYRDTVNAHKDANNNEIRSESGYNR